MAIEASYNYPSDLNATYPAADEDPGEGDDHIRGIKSVIKTTFPSITGAVTATQAELNLVDTAAAGTIVNSKAVVYGSSGEVNATTLQIAGSAITASADEINVLDGIPATLTSTELGYVDGVTSSIQTQLAGKGNAFPTTWNEMTADGNATSGQGYYISGGTGYTLTLPASPSAGDIIAAVSFSSGNVTCDRNGKKINGGTINVVTANTGALILTYTGNETVGWIYFKT